jgi:hypothetical protein
MKRRKKKERYRDSVAIDSLDQGALESVARALSSGTCSQTSKLGDLPDHPALEPVARALSFGTYSQTSKLGDLPDHPALEPIARALSFRTCSQTSKLGGIAGPACSGTYSQSSELWNL